LVLTLALVGWVAAGTAAAAEAARPAGLYARAERALRTFQDAYPTSAYGSSELGRFYLEQGRPAEAQAALERAVALHPGDASSWAALVHNQDT
jgi:predicted Zn-dependent protease